eukprot:scaffold129777_cov72-Phaeocystis_antarctica.AAC.2
MDPGGSISQSVSRSASQAHSFACLLVLTYSPGGGAVGIGRLDGGHVLLRRHAGEARLGWADAGREGQRHCVEARGHRVGQRRERIGSPHAEHGLGHGRHVRRVEPSGGEGACMVAHESGVQRRQQRRVCRHHEWLVGTPRRKGQVPRGLRRRHGVCVDRLERAQPERPRGAARPPAQHGAIVVAADERRQAVFDRLEVSLSQGSSYTAYTLRPIRSGVRGGRRCTGCSCAGQSRQARCSRAGRRPTPGRDGAERRAADAREFVLVEDTHASRDELGEHRTDRRGVASVAALNVHDLVERLVEFEVRRAVGLHGLVAGNGDVESVEDEVGGQVLDAAKAIGADVDDERGTAGIDRYGVSAATHGGSSLKEAELRSGNALGIDDEAPCRVDACPATSDDGGGAAYRLLTGEGG